MTLARANERLEPVTSTAIRPVPRSSVSDALLVRAHPQRSPKSCTMREIITAVVAAVAMNCGSLPADDRAYDTRFSEERARIGIGWVTDPSLVDTNNAGQALGEKPVAFSRFRTAGEIGGIRLGMSMSEVVAVCGKPRTLFTHCGIGPRFCYGHNAFFFFRDHRLVMITLTERLLAGLAFDNGLKAGMRRPVVEALLGPSTLRRARPVDDRQSDLRYVSGAVCLRVSFQRVSRTPTSAFQDAEEVDSIAVGFDDELNRRKSGEAGAAANAASPHR